MKNQNGFTLIEVLVTIVIFFVVFGAGLAVFLSIQNTVDRQADKQLSQSEINLTLHTIKQEVAYAVEAYYIINPGVSKELRLRPYNTGSDYVSFFYNTAEDTLSFYRLNPITNFNNSNSPLTNPTDYTMVAQLSDQLLQDFSAFTVYDENLVELLDSTPYNNGELLRVSISFDMTQSTIQGGQSSIPSTHVLTQKMIQD